MVQDFIAGIDIGGTKIALAIAAAGGEVIERTSFPMDACRTPHETLNQTLEALESLAEEHHGRLSAAGIGCAGPLDFERGIVISPPNMPRSWRHFPLRSLVESRLGVPVLLDNDANAAALGEHLYGAGQGYTDLVYLTISTGIGGGIIAGNNLVHRLGEAGHVTVQPDGMLCGCGARGCLEALCSGTAIARRAREYLLAGRQSKLREMVSDVKQLTAKTVADAVRENDELACTVWREIVSFLAIGIGSIVALLAPQVVILGGGVAAGAGELLLQPLRDELNQRVHIVSLQRVQVLQAGLGTDSVLRGALALGTRALQHART
jgi:glucokinase